MSVLGGIVQGFRDLKDFDVVICPKCTTEFRHRSFKLFGLFGRGYFWLPFALVALAMAFMAIWITGA